MQVYCKINDLQSTVSHHLILSMHALYCLLWFFTGHFCKLLVAVYSMFHCLLFAYITLVFRDVSKISFESSNLEHEVYLLWFRLWPGWIGVSNAKSLTPVLHKDVSNRCVNVTDLFCLRMVLYLFSEATRYQNTLFHGE